jgi:hypothetical protein
MTSGPPDTPRLQHSDPGCVTRFGQGGLRPLNTSQKTPVAVPGLTGVTAITAGSEHTCTLLSNGTVSCWGLGSAGELGDGTTTSRSVPRVIPGFVGSRRSPLGRLVFVHTEPEPLRSAGITRFQRYYELVRLPKFRGPLSLEFRQRSRPRHRPGSYRGKSDNFSGRTFSPAGLKMTFRICECDSVTEKGALLPTMLRGSESVGATLRLPSLVRCMQPIGKWAAPRNPGVAQLRGRQ